MCELAFCSYFHGTEQEKSMTPHYRGRTGASAVVELSGPAVPVLPAKFHF